MGDEVGGWSNRKKTFTVGGTLGALASLVTIVSFFTAHNGTPAPGPTSSPSPNPAGYSAGTTTPAPVATTSSQYPTSAQRAIVNDFLQGSPGLPVSIAQCELNWLEANVPYTTFEQDPVVYEGQADTGAPCVPP
jgi:hypothetical protein